MSHDGQWSTAFDQIRSVYGTEPEAPVWAGTADLVKPEPAGTVLPHQSAPTVPLAGQPLDPRFYLGAVMPKPQRAPLVQRCTDWLTSRTGIQTLATSLGVPSLLWAVAELFASQYPAGTLAAGALLGVGGGALAVGSLAQKWGSGAVLAGTGTGVLGLQLAMSAAPGTLLGFGGWLLGVAGCAAARVTYANRRAIPQAQADLIRAKIDTEQWKGAEKMVKAQHAAWKFQQDVMAAVPVAHHGLTYTPVMRGDESGPEAALMYALTPGQWADAAPARGLEGTSVLRCALTDAGIELDVRLDGRWDAARLAGCEGQIRALASVDTATRMHVGPGPRGDVARVLIRTRSASDGLSLTWSPGRAEDGICEITGEAVVIELAPGNHLLVCGTTGMGKSYSWRPLAVRAAADPLWAVVLADPKMQEATTWAGKLGRTVGQQGAYASTDDVRQGIYDLMSELRDEMRGRQSRATGSTWKATPADPNILVVIEEGRQLIEMAKDKRWADVLSIVDDLYTLARATGFQLVWATQYPSRTGGGITAMVSENTVTTVALTVSGNVADRVVFGEAAADTGWEPSKLDGVKGRALVKASGRKPNPARLLLVTDDQIRQLPDAEPWRSSATVLPDAPGAGLAESAADRAASIRRYFGDNPDASMRQAERDLGVSARTISRVLGDA